MLTPSVIGNPVEARAATEELHSVMRAVPEPLADVIGGLLIGLDALAAGLAFALVPLVDRLIGHAFRLPVLQPDRIGEHELFGLLGIDQREARCQHPAHGMSHHRHAADIQLIEQCAGVRRELMEAELIVLRLGRFAKADLVGLVTKANVLTYLEDVISNSGYGLLDDYANLWPAASLASYAKEDNKETIFAIKYTYTSDYNGNADGNH